MSDPGSTVTAGAGRLARTVAVSQLALASAFALVVLFYLARMAAAGATPADMVTGVYDPKDWIPFGMHPLNPLSWAYGLLSVLYLFGVPLLPVLLVVSIPMLLRARAAADRRGFRLLLAAALVALVPTVLRFLPFFEGVNGWWLD